jgi:hypothetical protein
LVRIQEKTLCVVLSLNMVDKVASADEWLGGKAEGRYAGGGNCANIVALLSGNRGKLAPAWQEGLLITFGGKSAPTAIIMS